MLQRHFHNVWCIIIGYVIMAWVTEVLIIFFCVFFYRITASVVIAKVQGGFDIKSALG